MTATSNSNPKLIVLSAPSGAGKTTLCSRLLSDFRDQLILSISTTTRLPRGSEKEGEAYFFVTSDAFDARIKKGEFAEWAEVHGNRYGTSKTFLNQAFARGKSVLLDIDVQGAESLRRAYPDRSVLVFVAPPSLEELEFRLRARGTDTEESIQMRMSNARAEMAHLENFDHVIINDDLDRAYQELHRLILPHFQADSGGHG